LRHNRYQLNLGSVVELS